MLFCLLILFNITSIILLSLLLIIAFITLYIYKKYNYIFTIKAQTIKLHKPISTNNVFIPKLYSENKTQEKLIFYEKFLRKTAYKNTTIKTGESFYDDSDMKSDYYLIVIFDKKHNTPLLSARYYFNKEVINYYLQGNINNDIEKKHLDNTFNIKHYKEGDLFLADRLSGNTSSLIYRLYRNYIFSLLYFEILYHNKNCKFILMARKEKNEKLLTKYLRLGLNIVSSNILRGKQHWILLGDVNKICDQSKASILFHSILFLKLKIK